MTDNDSALFSADDDHVDDAPQGDVNYLEVLVGEDKKFKSVEDLAKGKAESDRFVNQLQKELSELRKELGTRMTLEEFLDKQKATKETAPATPAPDADGNPVTKFNPEDIKRLVSEELTKEQQKVVQTQNLNQVKNHLRSIWGAGFAHKLEEKAQELEVGKSFLEGLAASNPKAFLKLVGAEEAPAPQPHVMVPTSTRDVPRPHNTVRRTFYDYEKLRKENPREYFTPRVQNEMHKLAEELGPAFYTKK